MSYTAPRGPCNYKTSLVSPACACLRFMIHPVKAATSFECDGCGHHASFHKMENKADDEIISRWKVAEAEKGQEHSLLEVSQRVSKRQRLTLEDSVWRKDDVLDPEPKTKRTSTRISRRGAPPRTRKVNLPSKGFIETDFVISEGEDV